MDRENISFSSYQSNKGVDHSQDNKSFFPQRYLLMKFVFHMCNTKRKIDLLRLNFPNFIQIVLANLRIKIGFVKNYLLKSPTAKK